MPTAGKGRPPARRGSLGAEKQSGGVAAFRSKDEAVIAARQLGQEVVRIQVKRFTGHDRKLAEFDMPAIDAADLIERAKMLSASIRVDLEPTPKLTAAMNGPFVGPFKTKKELFDALEAKSEG